MTGLAALVGFGLFTVSLLLAVRLLSARRWRSQLVAFRLCFPRGLGSEQIVAWLAGLPGASGPSRSPIAFEVTATARGIDHHLLVPRGIADGLSLQLQAAMPGIRLDSVALPIVPPQTRAMELTATSRIFPLATDRAGMGSAALLASLTSLQRGESIHIQWLLTGTRAVAVPRRTQPSSTAASPFSGGQADAEAVRALRRKLADPLLQAVLRVGVAGTTRPRARQVLGRVHAALSVMNAPGMRLKVSRWPSPLASDRLASRLWPLLGFGMSLNARELAGLLAIPLGDIDLPGLALGGSRQLTATPGVFTSGVLVAHSDHPLTAKRPLRLGTRDRLQHLHVIGPTGVGKSTLLTNLVLQDIDNGRAVVVIDPKRDLVDAITARVPDQRIDDVVVLDPVDLTRPIGFNPLASRAAQAAQELAAEHLLAVFRDLFADAWGPRTDDVMRAALHTLTATRAPDDSRFTICELPDLLTDARFRRFVLHQPGVPEAQRGFWHWFNTLSDAERAAIIAPSLNKLRAFTTRTPIRLCLGQSKGFDLTRVFTERRILLVPLSAGELGRPAAQLLGALLVAALWQATTARTCLAPAKRHPVFVYLDEFQDIVRLPVPLADMLAQARGLGVGLTLAHQYLDQLPKATRAAVLGTARSTIAFQLGHDDARAMEARFAPALQASDLTGLPAWHIMMRAVDRAETQRPVSGYTTPLPPPTANTGQVHDSSCSRFGVPRSDVEAGLTRRLRTAPDSPPLGRKRRTP